MKNFTFLFTRLTLSAAVAVALGAMQPVAAQDTGGPSDTPVPPTNPAPTPVPLDGGASLLLAGGVAYGLRQLRQRRKK